MQFSVNLKWALETKIIEKNYYSENPFFLSYRPTCTEILVQIVAESFIWVANHGHTLKAFCSLNFYKATKAVA